MGAACVTCHNLQPDELIEIESCTNKAIVTGPGFKTVGLGKTGTVKKALRLGPTDYIIVEQELSGELSMIKGPRLYFRGPFDRVLAQRRAIALRQNEYVKLQNEVDGSIRVVRGETTVYQRPLEVFVTPAGRRQPHKGNVWRAFEVDLERAALVRDENTGEQRLVTDPQLYFCSEYEEIIDVRHLISLADHETVVLRERSGTYRFIHGSDEPLAPVVVATPATAAEADEAKASDVARSPKPTSSAMVRIDEGKAKGAGVGGGAGAGAGAGAGGDDDDRSFFVPPYCSIETFLWSTGPKKDSVTEKITRIDRRPMFMNYEFECRTSDNVELVLKVTFFWQIIDVPLMLKYTSDPRGDVCHHARSAVIQNVTKCSMEEFMKHFNTVVERAIFGRGMEFYTQRGVVIHQVEVLHFHCKDASIEKVLQQIIQESTNRLNRLQQQESENEVAVHRLKGDIDEERLRGDLLSIRHSHHRAEALMEGEAEADRCKAFINGLSEVVEVSDALKLFNTLRKVEVMDHLSRGPAHMYFTPADCDLSIETTVIEGDGSGAGTGAKKGKPKHRGGRPRSGGSAGSGEAALSPLH